MPQSDAFNLFLTQAHRRRLAWRVVEHAAVGLLCACAAATALLPLLWWRNVDGLSPIGTILLIGALAGAVAALSRRPTMLSTAQLLDAQLDSPELLSSAWLETTRRSAYSDSDFVATLTGLASARVAGVSPATIVMRRLGSRAWSGVGLATAGVIVAAMMISPVATDSRRAIAANLADMNLDALDAFARAVERRPADSSDRESRDPLTAGDRLGESNKPDHQIAESASSNRDPSSDGTTGGGAARSPDFKNHQIAADGSIEVTAAADGSPTAGGAGRSNPTTGDDRQSGIGIAGAARAAASPPWSSATWPADRDAAMRSIQNGNVPDRYRSLMRDYFDRPAN